jgi:predicted DNA-binding transcriptional regulator AlpA
MQPKSQPNSPSGATAGPALLLRSSEVCRLLNCAPVTLGRIIKRDPSFPKPAIASAGSRYWRRVDLERWVSRLGDDAEVQQ